MAKLGQNYGKIMALEFLSWHWNFDTELKIVTFKEIVGAHV